jgi:hypothetical protein
MKTEMTQWTQSSWMPHQPGELADAQFVLVFGSREQFKHAEHFSLLQAAYPNAIMVGCSTSGEIFGSTVSDETLTVTAVWFEHTTVEAAHVELRDVYNNSYHAGRSLVTALPKEGLAHAFVLSEGNYVNGSELVRGITAGLPEGVALTGGLAGDADRFEETLVMYNGSVSSGKIVLVGLYGDRLKVGFGSMGGWDPFGPKRTVTRSQGSILYELDGQNALSMYKKYLGPYASELPASALLFPLAIKQDGDDQPELVRTILSIDENVQAMRFAGDIPEGAQARFMKANFGRLVDGAEGAAKNSYASIGEQTPDLAILISCVGRKLVLKDKSAEEIRSVRAVLGMDAAVTGFYSYGEICPTAPNASCALHNQTMTITTLSE